MNLLIMGTSSVKARERQLVSNSEGRDVIPCDLFAKIDFFA